MSIVPKSFLIPARKKPVVKKPTARKATPKAIPAVAYGIYNEYSDESFIGNVGDTLENTLNTYRDIFGNSAIEDLSFFKCTPIKVTAKVQIIESK